MVAVVVGFSGGASPFSFARPSKSCPWSALECEPNAPAHGPLPKPYPSTFSQNRQRAAVTCRGSLDPVSFLLLLKTVRVRPFVSAWAVTLRVALFLAVRFRPLVSVSTLAGWLPLPVSLRLAPPGATSSSPGLWFLLPPCCSFPPLALRWRTSAFRRRCPCAWLRPSRPQPRFSVSLSPWL